MKIANQFPNEEQRLNELLSYKILDTLPEQDFDNLTAIAAQICGTPTSLVSLLDDKRQWFKSNHGFKVRETPKQIAFCAHAINQPNEIFEIKDARKDVRFHDNPLVTDDPHVVFYAGVPLVSENGMPLGTICVIDDKPRELSQGQLSSLRILGQQVMRLLELHKNKSDLEKTNTTLRERNVELEKFAFIAAHDLRSPLSNISGLSSLLKDMYSDIIDEDGKTMLKALVTSSDKLKNMVEGLLKYYKSDVFTEEEKEVIIIEEFVTGIADLLGIKMQTELTIQSDMDEIIAIKIGLEQVFHNIISNAIKYNDKENLKIEVGLHADDSFYHFYIKDNGPGIPKTHQDKIFAVFETMKTKDKFGKEGSGIGLATVRKIVEKLGGIISVESEKGEGSKFKFTIRKQSI